MAQRGGSLHALFGFINIASLILFSVFVSGFVSLGVKIRSRLLVISSAITIIDVVLVCGFVIASLIFPTLGQSAVFVAKVAQVVESVACIWGAAALIIRSELGALAKAAGWIEFLMAMSLLIFPYGNSNLYFQAMFMLFGVLLLRKKGDTMIQTAA
jgi:hypothetical protein